MGGAGAPVRLWAGVAARASSAARWTRRPTVLYGITTRHPRRWARRFWARATSRERTFRRGCRRDARTVGRLRFGIVDAGATDVRLELECVGVRGIHAAAAAAAGADDQGDDRILDADEHAGRNENISAGDDPSDGHSDATTPSPYNDEAVRDRAPGGILLASGCTRRHLERHPDDLPHQCHGLQAALEVSMTTMDNGASDVFTPDERQAVAAALVHVASGLEDLRPDDEADLSVDRLSSLASGADFRMCVSVQVCGEPPEGSDDGTLAQWLVPLPLPRLSRIDEEDEDRAIRDVWGHLVEPWLSQHGIQMNWERELIRGDNFTRFQGREWIR